METKELIQAVMASPLVSEDKTLSFSDFATIIPDLSLADIQETEAGLVENGIKFVFSPMPKQSEIANLAHTVRRPLNDECLLALRHPDESIVAEAKDRLTVLNEHLVYNCAKKHLRRPDRDDIIAAGLLGMSKAIQRYQFDKVSIPKEDMEDVNVEDAKETDKLKAPPAKRAQFGSYAVWWINKEITIYLKNNSYDYSLGAGQKDANPVLAKICAEIDNENHEANFAAEYCSAHGISIQEYIRITKDEIKSLEAEIKKYPSDQHKDKYIEDKAGAELSKLKASLAEETKAVDDCNNKIAELFAKIPDVQKMTADEAAQSDALADEIIEHSNKATALTNSIADLTEKTGREFDALSVRLTEAQSRLQALKRIEQTGFEIPKSYEEVSRRFSERTNGRKLSVDCFETYMSLTSSSFVSLNQEQANTASSTRDDKATTLSDIIASGEDLQAQVEKSDEKKHQASAIRHIMNGFGTQSDSVKPVDAEMIYAYWIKKGYLQSHPELCKLLGIKTVRDVSKLIIENIQRYAVGQYDPDETPIDFDAEDMLNCHYLIAGRHGETRPRPAKDGTIIRTETVEIAADMEAFKEIFQSLSPVNKIALIQKLTDYYPADILQIAEPCFEIRETAFVSEPSRLNGDSEREISNDDIGQSAGGLKRGSIGTKLAAAEARVQSLVEEAGDGPIKFSKNEAELADDCYAKLDARAKAKGSKKKSQTGPGVAD